MDLQEKKESFFLFFLDFILKKVRMCCVRMCVLDKAFMH